MSEVSCILGSGLSWPRNRFLSGKRSCRITLNEFGMEHDFDEILTGSEHENVKAQSLKLLLKKYDLLPAQCLYIGDAVSDVSEAGKAGVICLSALWGTTAKAEELKSINADYIFETVGELKNYLMKNTNQEPEEVPIP